jgi:hypothetical protein
MLDRCMPSDRTSPFLISKIGFPLIIDPSQLVRNANSAKSQCRNTSTTPGIKVGSSGPDPLIARPIMEPSMIATMKSKALAFPRNRLLPIRTRTSVNP